MSSRRLVRRASAKKGVCILSVIQLIALLWEHILSIRQLGRASGLGVNEINMSERARCSFGDLRHRVTLKYHPCHWLY